MVTTLAPGDKIRIGDSALLIILAIEGNVVHVEIASSESGDRCPNVHIEGRAEADLRWWEWN